MELYHTKRISALPAQEKAVGRTKSKTTSRIMKAYRDETTGRWHSDLPDVFDLICQKLRDREPFSFARYGDGEFNAIYGKQGRNCDGHEYFPDMGKRLREALESKPNYIVGLQPLTLASERWPQIQKDFPGINWVDADSIHNASIDGELPIMFYELKSSPLTKRNHHVFVVGPKHLTQSARLFTEEVWEIPGVNCWTQYDEIIDWLSDVNGVAPRAVIILCASMMSEVIIHEFRYSSMTFIDMGSVLDPYVGVKSRRYHHKLAL